MAPEVKMSEFFQANVHAILKTLNEQTNDRTNERKNEQQNERTNVALDEKQCEICVKKVFGKFCKKLKKEKNQPIRMRPSQLEKVREGCEKMCEIYRKDM